jgi:hypothetical protein
MISTVPINQGGCSSPDPDRPFNYQILCISVCVCVTADGRWRMEGRCWGGRAIEYVR